MNLRPLHDRLIVERIEEGEQQVNGIIIPDSAKEKPQQGKVVAVGNGKVKDDGKVTPSTSRRATPFSSASTRARRSRSRAAST